jgi:polar amino acid transport system substrate-binding protein
MPAPRKLRGGLGVILGLCVAAAACAAEPARPLRVLVPESIALPLGEIVQNRNERLLTRGVIHDWVQAVGESLERPVQVVIVPRRREDVTMAGGGIDLRCATSPDWMSREDAAGYLWPRPLLQVREVVVGQGAGALRDAGALTGRVLGTVAGYHYPSLEAAFAAGQIKRDDAPNESAALGKLLRGHTPLLVMREMDLHYLRRTRNDVAPFEAAPWAVNSSALYCGVARAGSLGLAEYDAAQKRLLERGVLRQILQRYLGDGARSALPAEAEPRR